MQLIVDFNEDANRVSVNIDGYANVSATKQLSGRVVYANMDAIDDDNVYDKVMDIMNVMLREDV